MMIGSQSIRAPLVSRMLFSQGKFGGCENMSDWTPAIQPTMQLLTSEPVLPPRPIYCKVKVKGFSSNPKLFMAGLYYATALKCIYTNLLPLSVIVCIVSGGARHSRTGFQWRAHAQGIHRKQCIYLPDEILRTRDSSPIKVYTFVQAGIKILS